MTDRFGRDQKPSEEPNGARRTQWVIQASWLDTNGNYVATGATACRTQSDLQDARSALNLAHAHNADYRVDAWKEDLLCTDGVWRCELRRPLNAHGEPVEAVAGARAALHGEAR